MFFVSLLIINRANNYVLRNATTACLTDFFTAFANPQIVEDFPGNFLIRYVDNHIGYLAGVFRLSLYLAGNGHEHCVI